MKTEKRYTLLPRPGYTLVKNAEGPVLGMASLRLKEADGLAFKNLSGQDSLLPYEDWRLPKEVRARDLAGRLSKEQIAAREKFAAELDTFSAALVGSCPEMLSFEKALSDAQAVLSGSDAKAFDLNLESTETRERYGRNRFGQCCLAARRLVEAGVPYITINAQGWDTHKKHFEAMQKLGPQFDQGVSALLEDLQARNLLDSTLIWCTGEFGRTPKVDYNEPWNGGRNHYCRCFSTLVAGGGFAGGRVLGKSDARGERPIERPVSPVDLLWSIYELAGIDPAAKLPNPRNYDLSILPPDGGKNKISELYKEKI